MGSSETFGRAFLHPKTLHTNLMFINQCHTKQFTCRAVATDHSVHFKLNSKCCSTQWLRVLWDCWRCRSSGM